jgi:hypothetical protein
LNGEVRARLHLDEALAMLQHKPRLNRVAQNASIPATLKRFFRDVSPSPQCNVSDFVECLPAVGTPPPAKLAGFRHIPPAAHHIN